MSQEILKKDIHLNLYSKKQQEMDELFRHGQGYYVKISFFNWDESVIDHLLASFNAIRLKGAHLLFLPLGGAISKLPHCAFSQTWYVMPDKTIRQN